MTPGQPRLLLIAEPDALAAEAARWLAREMRESIAARGRCAVGLAGGRTPVPAYALLAATPLSASVDWARVEVFFGDERAVPSGHPESNFGMAFDSLLRHVPIPAYRIHRMEAERADRDAAAADYAALLPPRLDLLLLGTGPDGHTASLFPGSPALEERRLVVPATGPAAPTRRLTITPPVIASARSVAVLATGAGKAAAIARALEGPDTPREVPVQLARGGAWFLDRAAASQLSAATRARSTSPPLPEGR
jgi:6-phosphogluconolactonase